MINHLHHLPRGMLPLPALVLYVSLNELAYLFNLKWVNYCPLYVTLIAQHYQFLLLPVIHFTRGYYQTILCYQQQFRQFAGDNSSKVRINFI